MMRRKRTWMLAAILVFLISWPILYPIFFWKRPLPGQDIPDQVNTYQLSLQQVCTKIIRDSSLFTEGWDTLAQPLFWQRAMKYPPDSVIVNIAKSRQVIEILPLDSVRFWSEKKKKSYEDSLKNEYGLKKKEEIYFTTGRNHFYKISDVIPEIDRAIEVFQQEKTDPWYAQTILLIESPGRLQYSTDGAYGAFQLMAGVAKDMGLTVNDTLDERMDFDRSAEGAARLIKRVCLPHARALCSSYRLEYNEYDLWFRLLVMHIYHAGIGNVRHAFRKIRPKSSGPEIITALWATKSRRFGNASQNYSQIALGALLELNTVIQKEGIICPLEQTKDGLIDSGELM
jgi:hypothetical protein